MIRRPLTGILITLLSATLAAAEPNDPNRDSRPVPEYRGLALQIHTNYRVQETFMPAIEQIAATGANTVKLCTAGWMDHAHSQGLYIDQRKTPSRRELIELIRAARQKNLKVILMPMVLLKHPRGREWRGVIAPPNWTTWWEDYRAFIVYFAHIANEAQADALLVGSELVTTEQDTGEWVETIKQVRAAYDQGELGYSANWDTYDKIEFWDRLDFVGMTSYFELAQEENPPLETLLENWRPIYRTIMQWRKTVDKPIVFTEVGWCSQAGAAMAPWNYYRNMTATAEGHAEQRKLYEAFIQIWGRAPGVHGILWWEWTLEGGGAGDYGYTPQNKPAEKVLRRWFAETAQAAKRRR